LEHARKECEDFKKYFREQTVKFVENKLDYGDSGEHIPTNFGKGGMKNLVEQRLKSKASSSSCFTFEPINTQVCAVNVRQSALRPAEKGSDLERTGG
jgi:hypothetical protein